MKTIDINELIVGENRVRRDFDENALNELAHDISKPHGLLHAPVLRNDNRTLVVGERRIRAMELLHKAEIKFTHQGEIVPPGMIPYQTIADLNAEQLLEAEISENVVRNDLTWQEKAQAYAALDELRSVLNPDQTARDTAREILGREPTGGEPTKLINNSLALVDHFDDPQIRNAKTENEAWKTLCRKLEQEFTEELSSRYTVGDPNESGHRIIYGKAEYEMRQMGDELFDLIIADPPYGINADKVFGDMADLDHEYSDDPQEAIQRYEDLAQLGYAVCKREAHIYVFCDPLWFSKLYDMYTTAGWWVAKAPIIWDKGNCGLLPHPEHMPRRCYETILFGIKGKREAVAVYRDVISIPNIMNKVHAAQKPVELFAQLMRRSCRPGDRVLDPTCGSGTVFPAATRESLRAVGIESNKESYDLAFSRMADTE
ncbi:MAG: ParB N-terminal domain-containing protein [Deltaproteobacteria bacterium]|nr:ParB N-terminal domain-containing protein [Deltaproteobacteria bacterium]